MDHWVMYREVKGDDKAEDLTTVSDEVVAFIGGKRAPVTSVLQSRCGVGQTLFRLRYRWPSQEDIWR